MSNNLISFEKRIESWQVIHPRQWIATTDRTQAADFLSAQTRKITEGQLEAADRIIVSQDRIADKIDDAILATRDIAEGVAELQATFEWGFTELIWQIEQEREVLKNILKVLQAPLDTQAKELKKRAEYAYKNRWIDDAFKDFLESEKKNRYDFTIHENLGNIYFFEKKNPEKALEYYEKAVKYATPKSSYYTSVSLLHVGLVKYLQEDFQGAYKATSKAIELSPDFYEAHYQHAQYCANLGRYDEAIKHLKKAIVEGDKYYCVKADSEKDFNVMKEKMRLLFKEFRDEAQLQAKLEIQKAQELVQNAKSYGIQNHAFNKFKLARDFFRRGSYFDYLDAESEAQGTQKIVLGLLIDFFKQQISETEKEYHKKEKTISMATEENPYIAGLIAILVFIVIIIISAIFNPPHWWEWFWIVIGVFLFGAIIFFGVAGIDKLIERVRSKPKFKRCKKYYGDKLKTFRCKLLEFQKRKS